MRIKQIYVSPCLRSFSERMKKKYGLIDYCEKNDPAIFYGFFTDAPRRIFKHKSLAVIIWAGTDLLRLTKFFTKGKEIPNASYVEKVLKRKNVFHICRSDFMKKDLDLCEMEYKYVRVSPVIPSLFHPTVLGNKIYCYGCFSNPEKYGGNIIRKLEKDFPDIDFISKDLSGNKIPHKKMPNIYSSCFLNLRLTCHDGFPNSVLESGLMGLRSVYNGNLPGSIGWNDVKEIIEIIEEERKKIGNVSDVSLSNEVRSLLSVSDEWLDTNSYV